MNPSIIYIAVGNFDYAGSTNRGVFLDLESADNHNCNCKESYDSFHVEKWDLTTNTCEVLCERC